jgi:transposase
MSAPDLSNLSDAEKDALILTLMARLDAAMKRIDKLQARVDELTGPGRTSDNSSTPPSKDQKPNIAAKPARQGPRSGSLGRKGGGRTLNANPDETVIARPSRC